MKTARAIVYLGSATLAATAALHGTGYGEVGAAAAKSNLEGVLSAAVPGLWLFASAHWLFLAILATLSARAPSRTAFWLLGLVAAILAVDIANLLVHVGAFIGEALLGISAAAYAVAALLVRER